LTTHPNMKAGAERVRSRA